MVAKSGIVGPGTDRTDIYRRGRKVVFSVDGHHTADAASQAAQYVTALLADIRGPIEFIADLRNITGFSSEGRKFWQDAFEHGRRRIDLITLVRGTSSALMAASAVGLYVGVKVRSVETLEEALGENTRVDEARAGDSPVFDTPAPEVILPGPCAP